jgi:hypothetical protein
MLIKLSITSEMLPKVQDGNNISFMWGNLRNMHETSNKGRFSAIALQERPRPQPVQ